MMPNSQTFLYLLPYIISFGISLGVGLYAWRRKAVKGALGYAWVALSQASSTLGFIFELVSPTIEGKIFWDDFQWLGLVGWYIGILAFVLHFTEIKINYPKRTWFSLAFIPAVILGLVFTNRFHGFFHSNETLIPGVPFSALDYEITTAVILSALYGYCFILFSLYILIRKYRQSKAKFRAQTGIIFLGTSIPLISTMLTVVGIDLAFHRDYTPFTFAVGNLVVVYGIFRYQLLEIVPVAYQAVFENISDAVIVLDSQRRLVNFNPAAKQLVPRLSNDSIGQTTSEIFINSKELVEEFQGIDEIHTELEIPSDVGVTFQDVRISPLRNRRGDLIGRVIVARDITEQKQAEKDAHGYAAKLEAANNELESFSYSVSHDLRAPLRAIQGFGEILGEEFMDKLDDQGKDYLNRILANTEQMEELIEDLLRLSRVTSSEIISQEVNLSELAEDIAKALHRSQPDRIVEFEIFPNLVADCDQGLFTAVLENLLGNAWKFTSKQEHSKIVFGSEEDDGKTVFFVRDNGIGFDMSYADTIFNPFQRLHPSSEYEGSGIGLATVKRIIRRHGGHVWAKGEEDQGATFSFTLPSV
jgi:PAS domain S-box-containing protein